MKNSAPLFVVNQSQFFIGNAIQCVIEAEAFNFAFSASFVQSSFKIPENGLKTKFKFEYMETLNGLEWITNSKNGLTRESEKKRDIYNKRK